jgi:hypothetical protein
MLTVAGVTSVPDTGVWDIPAGSGFLSESGRQPAQDDAISSSATRHIGFPPAGDISTPLKWVQRKMATGKGLTRFRRPP